MSDPTVRVVYEFCGFRADPLTCRLSANGEHLALTNKAFETLLVLIANRGGLVSKGELLDAVWADTAVEENNLTQQIAALRRAFGERAGEHRFIVTLPGRGYSFVAPVNELRIDINEELVVWEAGRSIVTVDISGNSLRWLDRDGLFGSALALAYILLVCVAAFSPLVIGTSRVLPQTVAVLPFRTAGAEPDGLGDSIPDTLRARLGSLRDVTVRPAMSRVPPDDAVLAGSEMNAEVIVTGSIQRELNRMRVAVEMIDVRNRRIVWGQTFDYDRSRLFEMQDAIAAEVVRVVRKPLL